MTSLFCRHNRMTAKCPICSKEMEAELRAKAPPRPAGCARPGRPARPPRRAAAQRRPRHAQARARRRRRLPQPARPRPARDRGRRAPRRRADDRRRAARAARPYEAVATEPDREQASWLAFLLALIGPDAPELQDAVAAAAPRFEDGAPAELPRATRARSPPTASGPSATARRPPASPARPTGRRSAASPACSSGSRCPGWAARRASSCSPRSAPPASTTLEPDQLQLGVEDDATTQAAKRILLSGDKMLLERRARDLAAATDVPLAALDRGVRAVGRPGHRDRAGRGAPGGDALRPRAAVIAAGARPRPWRLLVLGCLVLAALAHFLPGRPDLRPVGVDHLGPRDHRVEPGHAHRPVVEAAAGAVHDAVRAHRRHAGRPSCGS